MATDVGASTPSTTAIRLPAATATASMFIFCFATWNLHGLAHPDNAVNDETRLKRELKREQLSLDCERYGIDVLGVQETKCVSAEDINFANKYRLIVLDQKHCRHGGIGFVISPKIAPYISSFIQISDRVAYMDIAIPLKSGAHRNFRVVNCYGLTSAKSKEKPREFRKFYQELNSACLVPSKWELFFYYYY